MPAALYFLYLNTFLALIGGNMFNYGLIILASDTAGSDGFTGLVNFAAYIPTLFLSFYAGTVLDRHSRLGVVYVFQSFFIVTSVCLATLLLYGQIQNSTRWILLAIALVNGCALAFMVPGRFALLGDIVPPQQVPGATIGLNILVIVGFGIAPVFVGLIKQYYSWHVLFFAISAVLTGAYLTLFPIRPAYAVAPDQGVLNVSAYQRFHDGLLFVRQSPMIRELLGFTFVGLFVVGPIFVVLPRFARDIMGMDEQSRGLLLSSLGAGLFFGGMLARVLGRGDKHGRWIMGSCLAIGGILCAVVPVWHASRAPAAIAGLLVIAGIFGGVVSTLIPAMLQGLAHDEVRGRVLSFYTLVFQLTPAISGFSIGLISDRVGLENATLLAGSFIALAAALGMLFSPELRRADVEA